MTSRPVSSPVGLQKYLKGMEYPAQKEDLQRCAEENDAPAEILDLINEYPERQYESPADVMRNFKEAKESLARSGKSAHREETSKGA